MTKPTKSDEFQSNDRIRMHRRGITQDRTNPHHDPIFLRLTSPGTNFTKKNYKISQNPKYSEKD